MGECGGEWGRVVRDGRVWGRVGEGWESVGEEGGRVGEGVRIQNIVSTIRLARNNYCLVY